MTKRAFRTDINGLRAYAVLAVVLFHFKVPGFSGGFVGVDVFFVISGFLMTGIILRGLESNNQPGFKLFQFYMARARRIIPALFFLCVVLLVLGWFLIAPDDYDDLGREVDRALLFISNIYYYKKSGYFDTAAHERLLLHTWSLSVEWQFYMLYPLVLMAIAKLSRKLIPYLLVAMALASLAWSAHTSHTDPTYAFYLLPSRTWEMLIGGLVFLASRRTLPAKLGFPLYFLGLAAILLSIFIYSPETTWPGIPALLPTLGTAAVILANKEHVFTKHLFFQRAGDWSYSIYLWHWPLAVALVLADASHFGWLAIVMMVLSVVLGWMSYRFVENPLRVGLTKLNDIYTLIVMLVLIGLVLWAASVIRSSKGFPARLPEEIRTIFQAERDVSHQAGSCHKKRESSGEDCRYGEGEPGVIVLGDSHAMSLMHATLGVFQEHQQSVLDWSLSACPTIDNLQTLSTAPFSCPDLNKRNFASLQEHPEVPVLVVNRFSAHLLGGNEADYPKRPMVYMQQPANRYDANYAQEMYQGYKQSLCKLASGPNPVYIMRPTPELQQHVPKTMGRTRMYKGENTRIFMSKAEFEQRNQLANQLIDEVSTECGAIALDPIPLLCENDGCYGDLHGTPMYFDDDHLNNLGSKQLRPLIERIQNSQLP